MLQDAGTSAATAPPQRPRPHIQGTLKVTQEGTPKRGRQIHAACHRSHGTRRRKDRTSSSWRICCCRGSGTVLGPGSKDPEGDKAGLWTRVSQRNPLPPHAKPLGYCKAPHGCLEQWRWSWCWGSQRLWGLTEHFAVVPEIGNQHDGSCLRCPVNMTGDSAGSGWSAALPEPVRRRQVSSHRELDLWGEMNQCVKICIANTCFFCPAGKQCTRPLRFIIQHTSNRNILSGTHLLSC